MAHIDSLFDTADFILRCQDDFWATLTHIGYAANGKGASNVGLFELALYDVEEPLKLSLQFSASNLVLVSHGSGWQEWEDYLQPLAFAQQDRMNSESPPAEYVQLVDRLAKVRMANAIEEAEMIKEREKEFARRELQTKLDTIERTFPLFDQRFPPELREHVLDLSMAIPRFAEPYQYRQSNMSLTPQKLAIQLGNRQLRDEAAHVLFRSTTFSFSNGRALKRFFEATSPKSYSLIRKISLSLGLAEYLCLFGASRLVDPAPEPWDKEHNYTDVLQTLKELNLDQLIIHLPPRWCIPNTTWIDSCHFVACKWIIKAAKEALTFPSKTSQPTSAGRASSPDITSLHSSPSSGLPLQIVGLDTVQPQEQVKELRKLASEAKIPSYEELADGNIEW